MAGISADVLIRLMGESKSLEGASKKGAKGLGKVDDSAGKADKSLGRLAARAATFAAGSVAMGAITGWINEGVKLADTADIVRKSWEKTFGESSKQLTANITKTAHALGLADFEAQQMLLTTGQLAKSMELSDTEAAAMAETMFLAAGDVAAFTGNLDSGADVMAAFTSALKGEFDALEGVGIKLKQADVNQRALLNSGKDSIEQLSKRDLAMATTEMITEQLGDEFGTLAGLIEDGTTASNENAAAMKENQEDVGQAFQDVKRAAEGALGSAIGLLDKFGTWLGKSIMKLQDMRDKATGVKKVLFDFLQGLIFWLSGARGGFQEFRAAGDRAFGSVGRLLGRIKSFPRSLPNPFRNWKMPNIRIPGFATGGTVPGGAGTPQLVMAHGGEQIGSRTKAGQGGGGGDTYVINVDGGLGSGAEIGAAVVDALQTYNRNTGAIAITTRTPEGIVS